MGHDPLHHRAEVGAGGKNRRALETKPPEACGRASRGPAQHLPSSTAYAVVVPRSLDESRVVGERRSADIAAGEQFQTHEAERRGPRDQDDGPRGRRHEMTGGQPHQRVVRVGRQPSADGRDEPEQKALDDEDPAQKGDHAADLVANDRPQRGADRAPERPAGEHRERELCDVPAWIENEIRGRRGPRIRSRSRVPRRSRRVPVRRMHS